MLRKSFTAAAIATGLLIAPGGPLAQQSNLTLRVANYGGVFTAAQKKYAGDLFTARSGVKIEYIDSNPPDHLAKLIASKGREVPFDVAYLDDIIQEQAIRAGVLERLDPNILTPEGHLRYCQEQGGVWPGHDFLLDRYRLQHSEIC